MLDERIENLIERGLLERVPGHSDIYRCTAIGRAAPPKIWEGTGLERFEVRDGKVVFPDDEEPAPWK